MEVLSDSTLPPADFVDELSEVVTKKELSNSTLPPADFVDELLSEVVTSLPAEINLDGEVNEADACNEDPCQLSCRCYAPSGETCYVMLSENVDGTYTVGIKACEPGLHKVEVESGGKPIPGSPFLVRIMQAVDEQQVQAYGPGLFSGLFDAFHGSFFVGTKGAGPGILKVRVHGPKKCFNVRITRENPKDRVVRVTYNPTEPGIYKSEVLWNDQHIRGSPYEILVASLEEDLLTWNRNREDVFRKEGLV